MNIYRDRKLDEILRLVKRLSKREEHAMSALSDSILKLQDEIKVATALIKQEHAENQELAESAKKVEAAYEELKAAVDSVMASSGPVA